MRVYLNLKNISVGNMILAVAGLIPGAWTTFLFVDTWGRKPIQLLGFIMLTILYVIMGASILALCTIRVCQLMTAKQVLRMANSQHPTREGKPSSSCTA